MKSSERIEVAASVTAHAKRRFAQQAGDRDGNDERQQAKNPGTLGAPASNLNRLRHGRIVSGPRFDLGRRDQRVVIGSGGNRDDLYKP